MQASGDPRSRSRDRPSHICPIPNTRSSSPMLGDPWRRADVLVERACTRRLGQTPSRASSGFGWPVKQTTRASPEAAATCTKFSGQRGISVCLKLTHHSGRPEARCWRSCARRRSGCCGIGDGAGRDRPSASRRPPDARRRAAGRPRCCRSPPPCCVQFSMTQIGVLRPKVEERVDRTDTTTSRSRKSTSPESAGEIALPKRDLPPGVQ